MGNKSSETKLWDEFSISDFSKCPVQFWSLNVFYLGVCIISKSSKKAFKLEGNVFVFILRIKSLTNDNLNTVQKKRVIFNKLKILSILSLIDLDIFSLPLSLQTYFNTSRSKTWASTFHKYIGFIWSHLYFILLMNLWVESLWVKLITTGAKLALWVRERWTWG